MYWVQIEERTADGSALRTQGGKEKPAATASDVFSAPQPCYYWKNNAYWDTLLNAQLGCMYCVWLPCPSPIPTLVFCSKAAFHDGEIAVAAADSSLLLLDIICLWVFSTVAGGGGNSSCIAAFLVAGTSSWMKEPSAPGLPLIYFTCFYCLLLFFTCRYRYKAECTGRHLLYERCLGP